VPVAPRRAAKVPLGSRARRDKKLVRERPEREVHVIRGHLHGLEKLGFGESLLTGIEQAVDNSESKIGFFHDSGFLENLGGSFFDYT
jgi:hypothetical protein